MKYASLILMSCLLLCTVGCEPVEKQAYKSIVAAKAFLDAEKKTHFECPSDGVDTRLNTSAVCQALTRATAAKDALIDAAEVYCSGPAFETGGACQPPAKGTAAGDQALAKLKAAIQIHDQTFADLKKLAGVK